MVNSHRLLLGAAAVALSAVAAARGNDGRLTLVAAVQSNETKQMHADVETESTFLLHSHQDHLYRTWQAAR